MRLLFDSAPSIFIACVHFGIPTAAYYLVYFEVDETISVVNASTVSKVELEVGGSCYVRVKGKLYKVCIVTYGEYSRIGVAKCSILIHQDDKSGEASTKQQEEEVSDQYEETSDENDPPGTCTLACTTTSYTHIPCISLTYSIPCCARSAQQ